MLPIVTAGMPLRSASAVLPWLNRIAPTAPAAAAFSLFCSKVHVPALQQGDVAGGEAGEVLASHPLVEVLPRPSWMSTGVTAAS